MLPKIIERYHPAAHHVTDEHVGTVCHDGSILAVPSKVGGKVVGLVNSIEVEGTSYNFKDFTSAISNKFGRLNIFEINQGLRIWISMLLGPFPMMTDAFQMSGLNRSNLTQWERA